MKIKFNNEYKNYAFIQKVVKTGIKITFDDGFVIKCGKNHIFLDDKEIVANTLNVGDMLIGKKIASIEPTTQDFYEPVNVEGHYYTANIGGVKFNNHNCSFLGSSTTLIDGMVLGSLIQKEPIETFDGIDGRIYEKYDKNYQYIIGVDVGDGTQNDYSCIQVLKIVSTERIEQVCVYANNKIRPNVFAEKILQVAKMYGCPKTLVENNGPGELCIYSLWNELEYEELVHYDNINPGVKCTHKTKISGCLNLKKLMEERKLVVYDKDTISELKQFERVKESYMSVAGHDDLVMSLVWAAIITTLGEFEYEFSPQDEDENDDFDGDPFYSRYVKADSDDDSWVWTV
ncbi:MAG: hypothetical protein MJZ34_05145 [Paludibacteraceae bacterium]|nr:hypothetical protein [Paludibacteraceae bacterium]